MNTNYFYRLNLENEQLLISLFNSGNQYNYLSLPTSPNLAKHIWKQDVLTITNMQLPDTNANIFCFSSASIGVYSGFFIYGIKKNIFDTTLPIFWGGHMVAQVNLQSFSAKDGHQKFWAGTPATVALKAINRQLQIIIENQS